MEMPSPWKFLPKASFINHTCEAGSLVFRQGAPTKGLIFLRSGRMLMKRYTETGDEVILHRASSNHTLAEASLFSDFYHCDAVAEIACDYTLISKAKVLIAMETNAEFAAALTRRFAQQIQEARRRSEIIRIKSAKERVLQGLKLEVTTEKVDWKSFASQINLTHEAVYRALAELAKEGVLTKKGRGIFTLN